MPAAGPGSQPSQGSKTGKVTEPLMAPHATGTEPLVLIIDGDAESRQILSTYFSAAGFRVAAFDDGGPALVQLREERPALIVADLILPMMPGEVLIMALRRSPVTSSIPILVVTAEPSRLGPEHEVDGILTKPVNVSVVIEAARRLVSSSAGTDSLQASRT
jgi:DNA-binding response OmpR family regulator